MRNIHLHLGFFLLMMAAVVLSTPFSTASETNLIFGNTLIASYTVSGPWRINNCPFKLLNYSDAQYEKVCFEWQTSKGDKDFLYTLLSENGTVDPDRVGVTRDRGICQLSPVYHAKFIQSPEFKDWRKQVEYCWKVYQGWPGAFIAHKTRYKVVKYFKWE